MFELVDPTRRSTSLRLAIFTIVTVTRASTVE
jgi:hypothetical protein